ncbi:MAG: class I adenylate-forming enzyme family protein [Paracoccaceae bacterium]
MVSIFDEGPFPPCPAPFNLCSHVLNAGAKTPAKVALAVLSEDGAEEMTYAQLKGAVLGLARGLQDLGLPAQSRILLRLGNTIDFPLAYLGALASGMVPVPTSSTLTEHEVAGMIEMISPALILHDPSVACPADPRCLNLEACRRMQRLPPADFHMGDPERPGYIVFTSGTSARPRAVLHAHRAIWARQMMFDGWYGLGPDDRLLHAGAFNWTYTLGTGLMDPWTVGATTLIPEPGTKPQDLPALLAEHQATIFAAAPGVYRQMLRAEDMPDLPRLRHGLSAGEKLPERIRRDWNAATGTQIFEAYGMSECSTFISGAPAAAAQGEALGRPQIGRKVAIVGPEGPVPRGEQGTIAVHRDDPGLMLGYLDDAKATSARMQGDWFCTGDQGEMAADGQITYLGRDDDIMNAGGFRVSPLEVEAALHDFPGLTGVGAAEVAKKADATIIAAFYTGPAPLDADALDAYVQSRLARYKQPRAYIHVPELPLGANGKLLRKKLRDHWKDTS